MNVSDVLCDLAACLCAAITEPGAPDHGLCFCGVMPGQTPGMMIGQCDDRCGQAWVRLDSAYPADGPALPSDLGQGGCGKFLGFDIEVGLLRCMEVPDDGSAPDEGMQEQAVRTQTDDMVLMRTAIMCCEALANIDYELGTYIPRGPEGLIIGGIWTVSVAI